MSEIVSGMLPDALGHYGPFGGQFVPEALMAALQRMLYKKQPERTQTVVSARFLPSCSAVKYMAVVRIPAMPAVIARPPTLITSCSKPTPAAPIRALMYT